MLQISELMEVEIKISSDENRMRPENSEVERLLCNNSKLVTATNWRPQYDLKNGLNETIKWIKVNINQYKSGIYNV